MAQICTVLVISHYKYGKWSGVYIPPRRGGPVGIKVRRLEHLLGFKDSYPIFFFCFFFDLIFWFTFISF